MTNSINLLKQKLELTGSEVYLIKFFIYFSKTVLKNKFTGHLAKIKRLWQNPATRGLAWVLLLFIQCVKSGLIYVVKPAQCFSRRVSALRLVGCRFDPRLCHTKDCRNHTHCLLSWLNTQGWTCGVCDLWAQYRSCPPLPQVVTGSNAEEKVHILYDN